MDYIQKRDAKILFYDIEVTPILGYAYGTYDTSLIEIVQHPYMLCFSYKWSYENKIRSVALPDYPARYKKDATDDYDLARELQKLLSEADIVVGHNSNRFDNKVAQSRIMVHRLPTVPPLKRVDTLLVARQTGRFSSNKLDTLAQQLEIGRKTKDTHGQLWQACVAGDMKAWKKMIKYCNQDVQLVVDLYYRFLPYINNHPNMATISQRPDCCPKCGSTKLESKGIRRSNVATYRRYLCHNCKGFCSERLSDNEEFVKPGYINYN